MDYHFYSLRVQELRRETPDSVSIVFERHPAFREYRAGQFLTIRTMVNGEDIRRAYSLCSSPSLDENPAITVKRVDGGKMSTWLTKSLSEGMQLDVMPAIGNFMYQPNASKKRWFMLFAAGSGITPVFSILKTVLAVEPQSFVSLLFGNRSKQDIIYFDELRKLADAYPSRLKIIHTLSQPESDWFGEIGRIDESKIMQLIEDLKPVSPFEETQVFICGPAEMMDSITPSILSQGVKKDFLHREKFSSSAEEAAREAGENANPEGGDFTVSILLNGKKYSVEVPHNTTILDAALDKGLDMPYSCQSGLCTACRGKCTSGKVFMDESDGLSEEEISEGYVLTCVGHPSVAGVEIEIG